LPSKRPADRLNDIVGNIDAIAAYTTGMTQEQFAADAKTRDATQHCLLRISEAAIKLDKLAEQLAPDQPWGDIRGLGNRLRHEYDRIEAGIIWKIVTVDLPPLRRACERAVKEIGKGA
jgi:uncharacterized protein with HEPN domain